MPEKTLKLMAEDVRKLNTEKGWREPGKTYGDYIALLHTEVGEMSDAFRRWGLEDGTDHNTVNADEGGLPKPEGIGAELADVLIRTLDTLDVVTMKWMDTGLGPNDRLTELPVWSMSLIIQKGLAPGPLVSFCDYASFLHRVIDRLWDNLGAFEDVLRAVVTVARRFGIDLLTEYDRKMEHNWQRSYRHGGKLI